MELKNLMDKLHHDDGAQAVPVQPSSAPRPVVPPIPRPGQQPAVHDQIVAGSGERGADMMQDDEGGVVLDLGDGISLNIPVKKRMSLTEFLRLAEKVKALEILGEEAQHN